MAHLGSNLLNLQWIKRLEASLCDHAPTPSLSPMPWTPAMKTSSSPYRSRNMHVCPRAGPCGVGTWTRHNLIHSFQNNTSRSNSSGSMPGYSRSARSPGRLCPTFVTVLVRYSLQRGVSGTHQDSVGRVSRCTSKLGTFDRLYISHDAILILPTPRSN